MSGNRYGWIPLPYSIEKTEFENILVHVNNEDKNLLKTWYELDENQLPVSYLIKQRESEYVEYENWAVVENRLREAFQNTVNKVDLSKKQKDKYFTSATEHEVVDGIFKYLKLTEHQKYLIDKNKDYTNLDYEHIYGYIRNIKSIEDKNFNDDFLDDDCKDEKSKINQFQKQLKESIKSSNIFNTNVDLVNISKDKMNNSLSYNYDEIENEENSLFVKNMIKFLTQSIDAYKEEKEFTKEELLSYEQENYRQDKLKHFLGRKKALNYIQEYINGENNQALVIYGKSGLGKSALIAKAIEETKKNTIFRFIGSTANLNDSPSLLISILKELGIEEKIQTLKNYQTLQDESEPIENFYFRISEHLRNIKEEKVIFIDAIDQVENEDRFIWLPKELPSNLKIIISALDDENYPEDSQYFLKLKERTSNLYKLEEFTNSDELISSILKEYNRTITPIQMDYVKNLYKNINTPLYLTIAVQELRHWRSNDKNQTIASSQKGVVEEFISNLSNFYHHDKEFVKRVFTYIHLSNGLSQGELYEILSEDKEFVNYIAPETFHTNITNELPMVIFSRLFIQIKPFLKEELKDNQVALNFFHREFYDYLSKQDDLKTRHEELISLIQRLITKYQNEPFESNRWGILYIELVKDFHINYEFDYDFDEDSKLYELSQRFLQEVDNDDWIKYFIRELTLLHIGSHNQHLINEEFFYGKLLLKILKLLVYRNKNFELDYVNALSNISTSYLRIGKYNKSIDYIEKAFNISNNHYSKNKQYEIVLCHINVVQTLLTVYLKFAYSKNLDGFIEVNQKKFQLGLKLYNEIININFCFDIKKSIEYNLLVLSIAKYLKESQELEQAIQMEKSVYKTIKGILTCNNSYEFNILYLTTIDQIIESLYLKDEENIHYCIEYNNYVELLYKENDRLWEKKYLRSFDILKYFYKEKEKNSFKYCKYSKKHYKLVKKLYKKNPLFWAKDYYKSVIEMEIALVHLSHKNNKYFLRKKSFILLNELYEREPNLYQSDFFDYTHRNINFFSSIGKYEVALSICEQAYNSFYKNSGKESYETQVLSLKINSINDEIAREFILSR